MIRKRKLIEVALPLEVINRESARENYIYRGNPSAIHKWWSQKPLATARAVIFAQLVDDPSSRPEEFPTEDLQRAERERLHKLIERLVVWENCSDEALLSEARAEIAKSTDGVLPNIVDPFAGGGTIPLEAQRLGLEATAADLNPVAVLISKALLQYPPKFYNQPPVFPGVAASEIRTWRGPQGLAADVRAYGAWVRKEASLRLKDNYPPVAGMAPIAYLWARSVTCSNPACGIDMPLVSKWWLSKRKSRQLFAVPRVIDDPTHPSGLKVVFDIRDGADGIGTPDGGTVGRNGAVCVSCHAAVPLSHIREEGRAGRIGALLMAVVVEGSRLREYLPADEHQARVADMDPPIDGPTGSITNNPRNFNTLAYGLGEFSDLFTARQLHALVAFSDVILEARGRVLADGGSNEYADAIATYLAFVLSKITDYVNSLSGWYPQEDRPTHLFTRQAIPMLWDFAELNPLSDIGGAWSRSVKVVSESFEGLRGRVPATVLQADAAQLSIEGMVISTDPPYYDSINYSDLSDFFYVWLRRTLRDVHPQLLTTMLVPKAEELVANPYRHNGKSGAKEFFEKGFRAVFARAKELARPDYPITVYYAFKQSETDAAGEASTGWETLLEGMIQAGWEITSTWPMRSERSGRMLSLKTNALASSIVLSLRPRTSTGVSVDRRGFIAALHAELPVALRRLQQGAVAPVDLPQAAIGPGMAVFSRYDSVLEADGRKMTVRAALARVNEVLDEVLNEQEGDFDVTSRFAIAWYRQYGYGIGKFGDADNLARARNTSVEIMNRDGILTSRAGNVQLIKPADMSSDYDVVKDVHTSNWEALHYLITGLEKDGITAAGAFLRGALSRLDGAVDADLVKELAHLLFRIAESNGWTKDALSFNSLVTSWPDIADAAQPRSSATSEQSTFDFDEEGD